MAQREGRGWECRGWEVLRAGGARVEARACPACQRSKGKELHIVKAGDTIEQRIHVKAVSPTGVALQETKTQVEKTVLLAGESK